MLFKLLFDSIIAFVASFAIIYLLTFAFDCIFLSDLRKEFSLDAFVRKIKRINNKEKK